MATKNPYPQSPFPQPQPAPGQPVPIARVMPAQAAPVQQVLPVQTGPAQVLSPAGARPIPMGGRPIPVAKGTAPVRPAQGDKDEDQPEVPLTTAAWLAKSPPWLVSSVVHILLLIILALCYIIPPQFGDLLVLEISNEPFDEKDGEQLENETFEVDVDEPTDAQDVITPKPLVDNPFAAPTKMEVVAVEGMTAMSTVTAPSIGMALDGREDGMKQALLGKYGGNPNGERAVMWALEWLARVQDPHTGGWSLSGKYPDGSSTENLSSATAMALLAFQGAGNTHIKGKFKKNVQKGWEFLIKQQTKDGNFFGEGPHTHQLYTHGQCTIAVCELYGMTKDPHYLEPAKKAVEFAQASQDRLGGWKYNVNSQSDTSVTGWLVMGLQSARMANIPVSKETLANVGNYLDKASKSGGAKYGYEIGSEETPVMTAEGLLCRQYLGWKQDDRRMATGADFLLASHLPSYSERNVYYWYYCTQVMHHLEGKRWEKWNSVMRDLLVNKQEQSGPEKGSWHPTKPTPDRWGPEGGRLFITCLSTYILEVYYRHLPIYAKIAL